MAQTEESDLGRFREVLFSHPDRFSLLIAAVLVLLMILLSLGLLGVRIIGGSAGTTVTSALSALLALGTLSLAYAAGFQAMTSEKQAKQASLQTLVMEDARLAGLRPCLDIQIREPIRFEHPSATPRPLMTSTFFTRISGQGNLKCLLRNMGPGNAVGVNVRCPVWYMEEHGPWEQVVSPTPPKDQMALSQFIIVENGSLRGNEDYEFELPIAIPLPYDRGISVGTYLIVQQLQLIATCKNVESNTVEPFTVKIQLQQISPIPSKSLIDAASGAPEFAGPVYELVWKISFPAPDQLPKNFKEDVGEA